MVIILLTSRFHKKVALLAIHWNRNRSCALGISEYRRKSHCAYNGLDINHHIRSRIEGTTLKITKIHATHNSYSCPLIDIGGVTP